MAVGGKAAKQLSKKQSETGKDKQLLSQLKHHARHN
jgi:hypothetical protein